jgi:crotonobetainyl-CoA:carnitine CoA-transferase CaiB-like acyl-CoA transferase
VSKRLTLDRRKEIFRDLVQTQDVVSNVPRSRQMVAKKFGITEGQLKQIEDEGIERQWPPLEDEAAEVLAN